MKVKVPVFSVAVVDSGIRVQLDPHVDFKAANQMDEDQWMYESIMSEEVDMNYQNEEECDVNESHVDCSDAFNTSQVFDSREDVLRFDTNTGSRGRTLFVLIGCERNDEYRCRKKEFVRRDIETRKCGCRFKLRGKLVVGGQGWMVKLMCEIHNHELVKSLVGHPYVGRLAKAEMTLIADMTKSMVKPRNIMLTLKEHNANSCTTIKQIYNARIPTKKNRYRLLLLDFVGVTPTGMTFSVGFAYLEGERLNNVTLINAVKIVFPECTNLLCSFHINKNVKAKCKSLIGQRNV
ncbi:hypothetical protein GmHk_08G021427 [Glycine max]|nr:hypothetical protein GmHk_08G021427 [Glycine max]